MPDATDQSIASYSLATVVNDGEKWLTITHATCDTTVYEFCLADGFLAAQLSLVLAHSRSARSAAGATADGQRASRSQLPLLGAVEKYGPCYYRDLISDFCRDNHLPVDFLTKGRFREALIDLANAGFIQRSPWVELTDSGCQALAAARIPTVQPKTRNRWWRR